MAKLIRGHVLPLAWLASVVTGPVYGGPLPPGRSTMAVMDFGAQNIQPVIGTILSGVVRNRFVDADSFTVLEQQAINLILQEQAFQKSGCTTAECAVEIGKLLNAKLIVVGEVSRLGREYEVMARVVDVESREIKGSASATVLDEEGLRRAAGEVADRLIRSLTGRTLAKPIVAPPLRMFPVVRPPVPIEFAGVADWRNIPVPPSLASRSRHTMVIDSKRNRLILAAGIDGSLGKADRTDTWAMDLTRREWRELKRGVSLPPRSTPLAFLDHRRDRYLVFGGELGGGKVVGDTWALNLTSDEWKPLTASADPPARFGSAAAMDEKRERVIVFGGMGARGALGDTWVFDLKTDRWREVKGEVAPSPRHLATATWDPLQDRLVLIGGQGSSSCDVWVFDLDQERWEEIPLAGNVPPRAGHSAYRDDRRRRIVMFGGWEGSSGPLGDTWSLDLSRLRWEEIHSKVPLSPRVDHRMDVDVAGDRLIVMGGNKNGQVLDDTWVFELESGQWRPLKNQGGIPARAVHALAWDEKGKNVFVVGGSPGPSEIALRDAWILDLVSSGPYPEPVSWKGDWKNIDGPNPPPIRNRHAASWVPDRNQWVITGGHGFQDGNRNDTWLFDAQIQQWKPIPGVSFSPRSYHMTTYDPWKKRLVLVGGLREAHQASGDVCWTLDLETQKWREMKGVLLPPRWMHTTTLDEKRKRLIVVGGRDNDYLNDIWILDLVKDQWMEVKGVPGDFSPRNYHAVSLDGSGDRLIIVGGEGEGSRRLDDVWALDLETLVLIEIKSEVRLPARAAHTLSLDRGNHRVLAIGGSSPGFGTLNDVWALDLEKGQWREVHAPSALAPRAHHTVEVDEKNRMMWVVGGIGSRGILGDVWGLDLKSDRWIKMESQTSLPPRCNHVTLLDSGRQKLVVFGGQPDPQGDGLGNTWLLDVGGLQKK